MKMKLVRSTQDRRSAILFGLVASALLVYEVLRAAKVSLTFDEAATQMTYLSSSVFAVFDLRSANNHLLYSLLAKLIGALAGSSELSLRLPSLLGYLVYLGFSWAILKRFFGRFMALAGFLFLNLNPFVLEYFSLGRGYGLALGFEMAALFFFLDFLDPRRPTLGERNRAAASLVLAFVSALANLSFLNVLMGLWTFLLLFYLSKNLMRQRQRPVDSPKEHGGAWSRLALAAVALSIPFNLIVIGQCLRLSERSTDPVLVRVHGLQAEELGSILVLGTEFYGNEIPLTLRNGAWVPPRTIYLKRLKLGISRVTLGRLGEVEIDIGARRLRFSRQAIRDWKYLGEGDFRYFLFDPPAAKSLFRDMSGVVNWRGDAVFFGAFAQEAALVVVGLALLLGLIYGLGRLAVRLKLLQADEIRPLWVSAGLAILYLLYPIYALNRNQALYYGGKGFIKDTVYSLIRDSFYGRQYAAVQERIVFWFMLGAAALAVLRFGRRLHKKDLAEQPETFSILAVMAIISLLDIAQGALFGIPLLLGRTAIFFIPLAGLFLLFLLRDLWRLGGAWRAGAAVVLITIVGLSSYHWVRTANLTHTLDWSFDADTKTMIHDVTLLRVQAPSDPTRVRLGVEWQFWPSSVYYRKRNHLPWLDVYMLPTPWNCDIYYLTGDDPRIESLTVLKRYPLTGNVLVR